MSEIKVKKGPWSWVGGVLCNENYIVGRFESSPRSEDKALIAAAPELLEALQLIIKDLHTRAGARGDVDDDGTVVLDVGSGALIKADNAIAKALDQ